MLYAFQPLLCLKLCWHNRLKPSNKYDISIDIFDKLIVHSLIIHAALIHHLNVLLEYMNSYVQYIDLLHTVHS